MESIAISNSRFRFRDHNREIVDDDSSRGHTTADSSSISSNEDEDSELQSMTAKGVQHLCFELLELKQESDEDFQRDIFSNYSAFIAILKEIEGLQSDLSGLKHQASSQKNLIADVRNIISLKALSEETIESTLEESLHIQPSSPSILEAHTENVSEILDTLLSEHRLDDALALVEMEGEFFQKLRSDKNLSSDQLMSYNSTISEKRAMLSDQFILIAKHPRVTAPELQKALLGICQLGDGLLATELLFQYYRSRIASGLHDLLSSERFQDVLYIQRLAKYMCSMISQAVRSYVVLNGETYPYSSELIQWTCEETEAFAACLIKYIASISEINGRLSTTVDTLQIAMSYCSLLENQGIFLQPSMIENIRPFIEEVLHTHIDHLNEVISIFTPTDTWVLGRYNVSGILSGRNYKITDQQPEYYFLTNSGRKFVTLFQLVAEEISPLIDMQMEGSVLKGLMDLFTAYIVIFESAISGERDTIKKGISRVSLPESPTQKVFILINLSTLIQFVSSIVRNIFHQLEFEIDNYLLLAQDTYSRLKSSFLEQFISNIFTPNVSHECIPESSISCLEDSRIYDLIPSVPYLELYLELRKLQKLEDDDCIDMNCLMSFLEEVVAASFEWIQDKSEIWTVDIKDLADHRTEFVQLILDTQFLVEIAKCGGYLTDSIVTLSSDIASRLKESFTSAGLRLLRDLNDEWPADAAARALRKLQELHAKELVEQENVISTTGEESNQEKNLAFEDDETVYSPVATIVNSAIDAKRNDASTEEGTHIQQVADC